jgi:hypothetical protein
LALGVAWPKWGSPGTPNFLLLIFFLKKRFR